MLLIRANSISFGAVYRPLPRLACVAAALGFALAIAHSAPVVAKSPSAKAAGVQSTADPECLTVTQSSPATYTIENTACPAESVLASMELAGEGDLARCFVKKIRTQISIASEGGAPVINYQCIEGAPGCSAELVRDMFPECHAG